MSSNLRTSAVAEAAVAAFAAPSPPGSVHLRTQLAELHRTARTPLDENFAAWAAELAQPGGAFPLLGTGRWTDTYPALLWCGARLAQVGAAADVAVLLAGLAAGSQANRSAEDLEGAVRAAEAVRRVLAAHAQPSPMVARPTTEVLAASTGAALLTGVSTSELVDVLDTAASLMVLMPGADITGFATLSPLWTGHACAAGWLASTLPGLGITAMRGALAHTLDVAAGAAPLSRSWEALLNKPLTQVSVRQLVESLA